MSVGAMAIRWRIYINKLNKIIEEQRGLIEELSQPVAVEEKDPTQITTTKIQLSETDAISAVTASSDTDVRPGIKAFMCGNYQKAAAIIPQFAELDHIKAQTILAKMYFSGNGVAKDMQKYKYWLQRAADNGDKPSKAKLKKLKT